MGVELPVLSFAEFSDRIQVGSPERLTAGQLQQLFHHYSELRRWNRRMSLVGTGEAQSIVERHYGEALAALPFLTRPRGVLVDVGSGGGFPGFVLSVMRPELEVTLVEARERKWSFLKAACRAASLSCHCLNARVGAALPAGLPHRIDWITSRAVRLEETELSSLLTRLVDDGSLLLWVGAEDPNLPKDLKIARVIRIEGTSHRRILEVRRISTDSRNS